jgi:hypothetical protein
MKNLSIIERIRVMASLRWQGGKAKNGRAW